MNKRLWISMGLLVLVVLIGLVGVSVATAKEPVVVTEETQRPDEPDPEGGPNNRLRLHGRILSIDDPRFGLLTRRGEVQVKVTGATQFCIPAVEDPGLDDLQVGDHVAVVGHITGEGTLIAKLVVRLPERPAVGEFRGELTAKGDDWLEITRPDGTPIMVLGSEETRFFVRGVEDPGMDDLNLGDSVFTRGLWNDAGELEARLVAKIPDELEAGVRGRVTAVNDPIIELETRQGPVTVITGENTRYLVPGVENPTLADIQVDDAVMAAGSWEDDGLHALVVRIIREQPRPAARRGVVTGNDGSTLSLDTQAGPLTVLTDENTRFRVAGVEEATIHDVQVGFQAAVAGRFNPNDGTLLARWVGARPVPEASPTP